MGDQDLQWKIALSEPHCFLPNCPHLFSPQVDNQYYLGYVNRLADEQSKKAHPYSDKDGRPSLSHTSYFKHLVSRYSGRRVRMKRESISI